MNKIHKLKDISRFNHLNNKEWLYQKYVVEKNNTAQIAKIIGCKDVATITRNLKKFDISIRSLSERRRNENNDYFYLNIPVINGSLLGDSFITKPQRNNWNSGLSKRNIHYDHLLFFASKIFTQNPESRISGPFDSTTNLTTHGMPVYFLNTYKHPEITELRNKWYVDGIKIIPKDIVLTKESILHWFLDDGYSYLVRGKYKNSIYESVRVFLCTNSFSKNDLVWMCDKLKKDFDLNFTLSKRGIRKDGNQSYLLKLSESQVNYFFDLIGECPIDSLKYKWKRI